MAQTIYIPKSASKEVANMLKPALKEFLNRYAKSRGISVKDIFNPRITHEEAEEMFDSSIKKHDKILKKAKKKKSMRRTTMPAISLYHDSKNSDSSKTKKKLKQKSKRKKLKTSS